MEFFKKKSKCFCCSFAENVFLYPTYLFSLSKVIEFVHRAVLIRVGLVKDHSFGGWPSFLPDMIHSIVKVNCLEADGCMLFMVTIRPIFRQVVTRVAH